MFEHHGKYSRTKGRYTELTCHWESTETPCLLQLFSLPHCRGWRQDYWLRDETILKPLDLPYHFCLVFSRAVVVNDAQSSKQRHVDSHHVFSHCIHRRRQEGGLEGDSLGNWSVEGNG